MDALVSFLTRRRKGGIASRDREVSCETLRFGRATDSEVYLPDPRIRLHEATLHQRPGGLFMESITHVEL